ncbi:MAG: hypothetical protein ABW022_08650 [Actinoplanes sp.]
MTDLWALHIEGPDDLIPMPSKVVADEKAADLNRVFRLLSTIGTPNPAAEPAMLAEVIPWTGTADEHAETMAEIIRQGDGPEWYGEATMTVLEQVDAFLDDPSTGVKRTRPPR